MKHRMREITGWTLIVVGIPAAVRAFVWRDHTAILLYHEPSPETLQSHLEYPKGKVDSVPLSQANSRGSGRPRVVVTFDDGHVGNAELLPIFIKYDVRATIYICSSIVAHNRTHWFLHPNAKLAGVKRLIRMRNDARLAELHARGFRQDVLNGSATNSASAPPASK